MSFCVLMSNESPLGLTGLDHIEVGLPVAFVFVIIFE